MRRALFVFPLALVLILSHQATAQDDATPPADSCAAFVHSDGALTWEGSGDVVTNPVHLDSGPAILTIDVAGGDWFNLDFYAWPSGAVIPGPMTLDAGISQDVIRIPTSGDYILDVDGGTTWTITLESP